MIKLAITGGIGTGKTYISHLFEEMGVPVFYADTEAKNLYSRKEVLSILKNQFGDAIFDEDKISFPKLTQLIFHDKSALNKLNGIIHPLVYNEFHQWTERQQSEIVMMESAIIFEGTHASDFDYIITVDASLDTRMERLRQRDIHITEETIRKKIANQLSQEEKCERADFVILHDKDNEDEYLKQQIKNILQQINTRHESYNR